MEEKHVITTKLGKLRGCAKQSEISNNIYYAFQGIPYAKPPVGDLRFKAPEPFGGWEGVRDAFTDGNECKQPTMIPIPGHDPEKPLGDEDCLVLNVAMNEIPKEGSPLKPVMVSIHGGGFIGGTGNLLKSGPDYLLEGDVVFVAMNYRCGAFGFLCLDTEDIPGNAGLKDQTLALKWVQDNIASFGGDPNNVTIFGISAGGASVNFHLLSPSSRGLFHKAIVQSGFTNNAWAIQREPIKIAKYIAKELGCSSENVNDIYQLLCSTPADEIVLATQRLSKYPEFNESLGLVFLAVVEKSGSYPFLAEDPTKLTERGDFYKVPVILGCTEKEGSVAMFFDSISESGFEKLNKNHESIVPSGLGLKPGSTEKKEAAKEIWDFYMKGAPISRDNADRYIEFLSDNLFNIGMGSLRTALLELSPLPVYTYLFTNHTRCICLMMKHIPQAEIATTLIGDSGACHGADSLFLYVINWMPLQKPNPEEKIAIQKHCKVWTTFALTGDPNPKELGVTWEKDSLDKPCFMDIGPSWTLKKGVPFADRLAFWKKLTSKYCV